MLTVDQLCRELRLALRRLLAAPIFTTFAVVSLALGLGVTTAVYSTIGVFFGNSSSVEDPNHLMVVTREVPGGPRSWNWVVSTLDFDALRRSARAVPALAASSAVPSVLNDGADTNALFVRAVTGNYFAMARLPLALGRGIQEADDRPDAEPVVVLSHEFWQSKAQGNHGLVGRTVRLGGHPFVVIGVVAKSVGNGRDGYGQFGLVNGDAWIPLSAKPIVTGVPTDRDDAGLTVIARLPVSTPVQSVAAEVRGIGEVLDRATPTGVATREPPVARAWVG